MGKKGIFITGTDTEVGKTIISCAIVLLLKSKGFKVCVMKPVETGCNIKENKNIYSDGLMLKFMANVEIPLENITPFRFKYPLAPVIAAELENKEIQQEIIYETFQKLLSKHDYIVVEGIGGIMVPLKEDFLVVDLVKMLRLPILIVANNKLGVINHTLLTYEAAIKRGIEVKAIILNSPFPQKDISVETNSHILYRLLNLPVFTFPFLYQLNKENILNTAASHLIIDILF